MNLKAWTQIMKLWIIDIICENQPPKGTNLYISQSFWYIVSLLIWLTSSRVCSGSSKFRCIWPHWQTFYQYTLQNQQIIIKYCTKTKQIPKKHITSNFSVYSEPLYICLDTLYINIKWIACPCIELIQRMACYRYARRFTLMVWVHC